MMLRDQERLINAARSVIQAERQTLPHDTVIDQMAARLLLLSDRIRELGRVVEEIELAR